MTFQQFSLRRTHWLLIALTTIFVFVRAMPPVAQGIDIMPLPMHIAMETFAIIVAMMVFAVTWNAYDAGRAINTLILACGFLAIGTLDFGHMFSFKGMPDFVTPSGPEKAIQFWLSGRLTMAIVLLSVALYSWRPLDKPHNRYLMLCLAVAGTALVYWTVLFHGEDWPRTFIDGQGLTTFKIGVEYSVIAILAIAAFLFYRQSGQPKASGGSFDRLSLLAACFVSILSELCFVLYGSVSDVFNLLGHLYKVVAYIFIYRAVFIDSVREPFVRLKQMRDELADSQRMLQSIISTVPVRIFWKDKESKFLGANDLMLRDAGLQDVGQLLGKSDSDFFPHDLAEHYRADDLDVMMQGQPKSNIEEKMFTADGRDTWLLTSKAPLRGKDGEVIGILGAYQEITAMRETELHLKDTLSQLRELTVRREEAREAERKRIAQDLHDDLGQMLTSLRMEVALVAMQHNPGNPVLVERLNGIKAHIDNSIQVVRDVAAQLRPAVLDAGIAAALEWQVMEFTNRSGISCELTFDSNDTEWKEEQATTLFRIVQESFTNIMRHAQAHHVHVRLLQHEDHHVFEIRDDGVGFDPALLKKKTFGLVGIGERALVLGGAIDIDTAPGKGTKISVSIPITKQLPQ